MIVALIFVIGLTAASAQTGTSWYCTILRSENCDHHTPHPKCGTDGITYENTCAISKAHCVDNSVDQKHDGPCTSSETVGSTSTRSPAEIVKGSELIRAFQCIRLGHVQCTFQVNEKICATDGRTYQTFCEYEKARCTHGDLHVQKMGDCP